MTDERTIEAIGFEEGEIDRTTSVREARLKWVIVADSGALEWRRANAIACIAAATGGRVAHLLGPDERDGSGALHPGLPWSGCTLLGSDAGGLVALRARAAEAEDVLVVGMPAAAQQARSYGEYRSMLGSTATEALGELAIGLIGPRRTIERLTKKLRLLG